MDAPFFGTGWLASESKKLKDWTNIFLSEPRLGFKRGETEGIAISTIVAIVIMVVLRQLQLYRLN